MKKLFAIVMVLAMALAIAAPALASGWDQIVGPTPTTKDITVEITALQTSKNTSVLGSLYEQVAVMYPVVKGTLVHFFVAITIPKEANLSAATKALLANKGLVYELNLTNLEFSKPASFYLNGTYKSDYTPDDDDWDYDVINLSHIVPTSDTVYGFEYWATGLAAGKDAVAAATIGFYQEFTGHVFNWDNDVDGVDEYVVTHETFMGVDFFKVMTNDTAANTFGVWFPVNDKGQVRADAQMGFWYKGFLYTVNRAVNGEITFLLGGPVIDPSNAAYADMKAKFDSIFAALGFGYADAKYMSEEHFDKYFGTITETTVKIVYPSGAVVVAPPSVEPPQTGDANTVVGFVMIALALVAAAAVTVKKVRA